MDFGSFENLRFFHVYGLGKPAVMDLSACKQLEILKLYYADPLVLGLQSLKRLTRIKITRSDLEVLPALPESLEHIDLLRTGQLDMGETLDQLSRLPHLRDAELRCTKTKQHHMDKLLVGFPSLQRLGLRGCNVMNDWVHVLGMKKTLTELDLSYNDYLDDEVMSVLAQLLPGLSILNIKATMVCPTWAQLEKFPCLSTFVKFKNIRPSNCSNVELITEDQYVARTGQNNL